jgi:lysophospholipase L1-like esterase
LASGQPELLFIPYAAFNGYFGLRIDLSAPVMQWCESDSFGLSYGPSSAIGAHDGQGFQDTTLGTPTNDLDSEFTLFQMTSFGPLKYTSANYTLGGYFVGEFLTRAELESLTLEMKLIHHRARGIVRTPLWVGIGDSITFGAGVSDSWDNGWFQQSAFAHGARKHVSAIFGGLTVGSAVGAVNTGLPVEHRYLKLKNISPDVVTVLCGTNDQDPTIVDATTNGNPTLIAAYQAGLTTILTEIKTWGTTAVMLSPPYNERDTLTKQLVYASAAMAAASAAGVTGINVVLEMVSTGDPGQFFDADPIHPNQAGHNFISSLLLAQIPV